LGRKGVAPLKARLEVLREFFGLFGEQLALPLPVLRKRARAKGLPYTTIQRIIAKYTGLGILKMSMGERLIPLVTLIPEHRTVLFLADIVNFLEEDFEKIVLTARSQELKPLDKRVLEVFGRFRPVGLMLQDPLPTDPAVSVARYISEGEMDILWQACEVIRKARVRFIWERLSEGERKIILDYEEKAGELVDKVLELIIWPSLEQWARALEDFEEIREAEKQILQAYKDPSFRSMVFEAVLANLNYINRLLNLFGSVEGLGAPSNISSPEESPLLKNLELKPLYAWLKEHQEEYQRIRRRIEEAPRILFLTGEGWGD
jgi:hypothetical protein